MDLVQGAKRVVVIMEHVSKQGEPKIRKECTLPLTGQRVVHRLITEFAVFDFTDEGMVLVEKDKNISLEELKSKTEAYYIVISKFNRMVKMILIAYVAIFPSVRYRGNVNNNDEKVDERTHFRNILTTFP